MFAKLFHSASWLMLISLTNTVGTLIITFLIVRNLIPSEFSSYLAGLYVSEAITMYGLLQYYQVVIYKSKRLSVDNLLGCIFYLTKYNYIFIIFLMVLVSFYGFYIGWSLISFISFYVFSLSSMIFNYLRIYFSLQESRMNYKLQGKVLSISGLISLVFAYFYFLAFRDVSCLIFREISKCVLAVVMTYCFSTIEMLPKKHKYKKLLRAIIFFSLKKHGVKLLETTNYRFPVLYVTRGDSPQNLSIFGVSFQLVNQLLTILNMFTSQLAFSFFSLHRNEKNNNVNYFFLFVFISSLAVNCVLVAYPDIIVSLLYGSKWSGMQTQLVPLSSYIVSMSVVTVFTSYFTSRSDFKIIYFTLLFGGFVSISLAIYFNSISKLYYPYVLSVACMSVLFLSYYFYRNSLSGKFTALFGISAIFFSLFISNIY